MIKNILVPMTGFECDKRALEAAFAIASRSGATIEGLRVSPGPMQIVARAALRQFSTKMGHTELLHWLQNENANHYRSAKAAFEEFTKRHADIAASWREIEGDTVQSTIAQAHYSDLLVFGRAPAESEFSLDAIGSILVSCGRPVLLVPDTSLGVIGSTVAIAWKESAEATRAVAASMPILAQAKHIVVLTVDESGADPANGAVPAERLAKWLKERGCSAEAHHTVSEGRLVTDAILAGVHEYGADLIVMGAYSHSRLRELVFGGVTRHVLQSCDLPVLLMH